jgi:pyrimidine-specific ribonucleoside hydrolase
LGPLTNLAELLLGAPQLADKIASITMMGGALNVPGNLAEMLKTENTFAEWNLYIDPYAADVVLRSGVPITVVPLDATNQVPLTDAYFERLNTQARSPAAQFVAREVRRLRPLLGKQKFYFWDPLAAVLALHPQIGEYESRRLRVIQDEGRESGRLIDHSEGAEVRVCTRVDAAAFERIFLDTLNG